MDCDTVHGDGLPCSRSYSYHIISCGWQLSKIDKEAPRCCVRVLRSHDSADENLEHPNLVE